MKYEVIIKESDRGLEVDVPDVIAPVAILLMGDIQSNSQPWLKLIHKVLNGDSNFEECTGNNCTLEIRRHITKIIDNYSDEEDEECTIETNELETIIELWSTKLNGME
ncbi:hypothetical protein ABRT01_12125 [Lentibacillus sp. L22]|uniref:hypothetical protein n=1 Tax=Lentibacillus TaxID=175304 RepID=UPI0022B0B2D4|nr:hypothetical protein [Lentibacillus daqui]